MTDTTSGSTPQGTPRTLVGISFGDTFRAQEFPPNGAPGLRSSGSARRRGVRHQGRERPHDGPRDHRPRAGRSALSGAVWASLFGLILGGPVGWVVGGGGGAGTGAVAAKIIDHGVSDEWVAWFRESVAPGTTILALLVEDSTPRRWWRSSSASPAPGSCTPTSTRCGSTGMRSALGEPRRRWRRPRPRRTPPGGRGARRQPRHRRRAAATCDPPA